MGNVWKPFRNPYVVLDIPRKPEDALREMLALFPDRTTFEEWATARGVTDEQRAHMEQFLPKALQAQGTV